MGATAQFDQQIPRTSPSTLQPAQHPARQQVVYVPQRRIRRTFTNRRPLGIRQLTLHAVQHVRRQTIGARRRSQFEREN